MVMTPEVRGPDDTYLVWVCMAGPPPTAHKWGGQVARVQATGAMETFWPTRLISDPDRLTLIPMIWDGHINKPDKLEWPW